MPSTDKKFTDQNLKWLYGNLLNHYVDLKKNNKDINVIYNQMYNAVCATVSPQGFLQNLSVSEKNKVFEAFNAIFYAFPIYTQLDKTKQKDFKPDPQNFNSPTIYVVRNYNDDSLLFNWMFLSTLTHSCHHRPIYVSARWPTGSIHGHVPGNLHQHIDKASNDLAQLIAALFLLLLAASAAVIAAIALYYMFSEFLNGAERFYYNEGWLKAGLMMASSIAAGSASTVLSLTVLSTPLISLAIMAGFNPVGVVIVGAVLLTIIGAGIGCFAMDLLYGSLDSKVNSEAMDPQDPLRFRLTADEENDLISHNINPTKVRCALVALRAEISKIQNNEKPIPSFLNRHFGDGAKIQDLVQKVRQLRQGDLREVEVGGLYFDCNHYYYQQQNVVHPPQYSYYNTDAFDWDTTKPSAPPSFM